MVEEDKGRRDSKEIIFDHVDGASGTQDPAAKESVLKRFDHQNS